MKCIKSIIDSTKEWKDSKSSISRVSNEKAVTLINTGKYIYCSKKEWKDSKSSK